MPDSQLPSFYVHIVESPSPADLLDGRTEGRVLCSFLDVAGIPYLYNLAVDANQFSVAMTDRILQGGELFGLPPILHISCHGAETGIQLTDQREAGVLIPWSDLATYLRPIHQFTNGLGVCMSSCHGGQGRQMAQVLKPEEIPFSWIVGAGDNIDLRDVALAYAVFYRCFQRGNLETVIDAMHGAAGGGGFQIAFGQFTQQQYRETLLKGFREWLASRSTTQSGG